MISAQNAEDRVTQLIGLTRRLTGFLAAEAAAFEARRPQDAIAAGDETAKLANLYRHESARIKAEPELIADASEASRRVLMQVTGAFEAVLARHGRALAAAKAVTEGLVQAIAEEVAAARQAITPYGADAKAPTVDASAITLNRTA